MVFGIGEGKMDIVLEKQSYMAGELLKGKIILTLNQAKKAKELRVKFYGEYEERISSGGYTVPGKPGIYGSTTNRNRHYSGRTETERRRIYEQTLSLGGEQEYLAGTKEYEFQFQLPTLAPSAPASQTQAGGVLGVLAAAAAVGSAPRVDPVISARWYVDASLDLSMSFDISKKVQINLVR